MTPQELDCNDTESCQNSHSQHDESQNQSPNRDIVAVSGLSKVRAGRFDGHFNHLRYVIIMLSGLATGMMLFMRVSLSVAIISMVNRTALWQNLNVTLTESPDGYVEMGEFVWTNEIQQIILAGYMAAYALPQYFTLRWTMNYGIRISIPVALSTCALSVVLTPIAAYWGWEWVLALRLLNGLGASPMFPSMINTVESWTSKSEKTLGLAIAQFSCNIIHATTPLLTGYLASTHWKWSFYMPGAVALVFCVLWYVLVADHPAASSLISRKELEHLVGDGSDANGAGAEDKLKASAQLPWYFMFKLPAFYPILIMMILFDCTSGGFLFLMPQYLRRIMEIPVEQIGIINFIVQIGSMFCMLWSGPASALFQRMFNVSLTTARKMVTCICAGTAIATYAYLGYAHDHLVITIVLNRFFHSTNFTIYLATVMSQFGHAGASGLIYGMSNTWGNLLMLLLNRTIGLYLDKFGESLACWSGVMYTFAAMNVVYLLNYLFFCSSEPEPVVRKRKNDADKKNNDLSIC